ncbi:uncharacterized protein LOC133220857 [Neopsephotus bourkii]|uniref:uncharacterized protein LOC133220857 n=1 Tax=Neopsephotus bourkii TaxID=309878 RepID=UPI002AA5D60E|nr:uncharacterized protein LOC133220857 [Neopsephotus bourkii]
MRKKFTRQPGEHIITWLLRCWDNGADGHELEGTEAKQLGSLAREGGIDKAIAREKKSLSLWRRLLAAVKERFPYKDNVMSRSAKWTTIDKGIQSLRESAIVEMIYHIKPNNGDIPIDPDEVECTRPMWRKLTRNAPSSYAHSLATVTWNDVVPLTVDEMVHKLHEFEDNLTPSIISAVEKLSQDLKQLRDNISDLSRSSHVPTHISAINKRRPTVRERRYKRYTPRATLQFYLWDHGEDMTKWDGKPTSVLEEWVSELKRGARAKTDRPMRTTASVSGPWWLPAKLVKPNHELDRQVELPNA